MAQHLSPSFPQPEKEIRLSDVAWKQKIRARAELRAVRCCESLIEGEVHPLTGVDVINWGWRDGTYYFVVQTEGYLFSIEANETYIGVTRADDPMPCRPVDE